MPTSAVLQAEERLGALVAVLDVVRKQGAASRADLADATGLGRSAVAQRAAELADHGLVAEDERGRSTGGRAPRLLRFRAEAGHLLVAALGATSVDVAVTDLGGGVLAHREERIDVAAGPDLVLGRVDELFRACRAVASPPGALWGIGIGVPGPVEFESGRPVSPPIMPGWDGYPVRERFAAYGAPLWLDNDVNVLALGELRAGVARGHDTVVYVKIGTGIGAGIVVGGELHRGAQGSAGDIGHIQAVDEGRIVCRCGNVGCLEALAGGAALARDGDAAARDGRSPFLARVLAEHGAIEARDVGVAASHGDPASVELIAEAGRQVGRTLAGIVNFFNPSLIVVGGGVAAAGDVLLAAIRETVYRRSLPLATRELAVQRSSLEHGGAIGTAAMVADQLFAPRWLARWLAAGTPASLKP